MVKRKVEAGSLTSPIDVDSSDSVPPSKHRTCWKHMAAFLHAHKKKISKEELKRLELTSPCFLGTFPCCQRSKRIIKRKNEIPKGLKEKKKLDTEVFQNYFENLWNSFTDDKKISFAYFESLWYNMYATKQKSQAQVLTWIKRKDVFSKKYVLVPIVCWGHWSLLIFCHLGESFQSKSKAPCMLLLDSLEMANPKRIEPDIRKFLLDIYRSEGRDENKILISKIPFLVPKVPQQRDDKECGNFVLYFIKLFVEFAPDNFSMDGYPYFMKQNWFKPESLECFFEGMDSSKSGAH